MSRPRGGLGRGLAALIPASPVPESAESTGDQPRGAAGEARRPQAPATDAPAGPPGASAGAGQDPLASAIPGVSYLELPLDLLSPNPRQPRRVFDEAALEELAASIREVGLLQPLVARPTGTGHYELVMGERRWRAARVAGLEQVPVLVRQTADTDMLRDALLENLHRAQLNPLEEAAAYAQLLEEFGATHEELAARVGRSRPQVTNTLRLLGLPPAVQRRVAAGVLSAGHARALLGLTDPAAQEELAGRIVAEGLSVRAVEELVAVGEPGRRRPRSPAPRARPAELDVAAARLADRLDTRVRVDLGRGRGRITVEFAGLEDLERLVSLLT